MTVERLIYTFDELTLADIPKVGGKNASLGELRQTLTSKGIRTPDGFALSAAAYWQYVEHHSLRPKIQELLRSIERPGYSNLAAIGKQIREQILQHPLPDFLCAAIAEAVIKLSNRIDGAPSVAVRSSATAEDLPTASFAGQLESFLNVKGIDRVIEACLRCYASLFTDRAIKYREDNGFEHDKVAISVGVQQMVRSDLASAGVAFTLDPETGHDGVIFITGSWGLGENVVQGVVNPDEFYLFKRSLELDQEPILSHKLGSKSKTMVYGAGGESGILNTDTPVEKRNAFVLTDAELAQLGAWLLSIEQHYGRPMDVEWAKDGISGELFIVQARPETVHSQNHSQKHYEYHLLSKGKLLAQGEGLGNIIVSGRARVLRDVSEGSTLESGDIIVTTNTNPDWDPVLKKATGIITDRGGRTSHAAIVARELGIAAVVGCTTATGSITDGSQITVVTSLDDAGSVYDGKLDWKRTEHDLSALPKPRTKIMLIMADPGQSYRLSQLPVDGVGLLRMEFAITNAIRVHPMALAHPERIQDPAVRSSIAALTAGFSSGKEYFVTKLSEAIATTAAAFYPREVIVRMSDFKSNEYADLMGGSAFEPKEENPMIGFRGASRYYDESYRDGFALECEAVKRVRDDLGMTNVKLMIPFCRTVDEGKRVLETMEAHGLRRGHNGLEIYVMAEIPSNVILADKFASIFDGFSIGSNDLTQLTLGIDRDSVLVHRLFDENNEAVTTLITDLISRAHLAGRPVGLCGQAPSDHPVFAKLLVECGIDSISFNADAVFRGIERTYEAELLTARSLSPAGPADEVLEYE